MFSERSVGKTVSQPNLISINVRGFSALGGFVNVLKQISRVRGRFVKFNFHYYAGNY